MSESKNTHPGLTAFGSEEVASRMRPETLSWIFHKGFGKVEIPIVGAGEKVEGPVIRQRCHDRDRGPGPYYLCLPKGMPTRKVSTGCRAGDEPAAVAFCWNWMYASLHPDEGNVPPGRIDLGSVLDRFEARLKERCHRGEIKEVSRKSRCGNVSVVRRCLPNATLADVRNDGGHELIRIGMRLGLAQPTCVKAARALKEGVNAVMAERGHDFRLHWGVPAENVRPPNPFTPAEYDRIMHVVRTGERYGEDLQPRLVLGPDGSYRPERVPMRTFRSFRPFLTAIPLMLDTGSRKGVCIEATVVGMDGSHIDIDRGIFRRRGRRDRHNAVKPRSPAALSDAFLRTHRPMVEEAVSQGIGAFVHNWKGDPVKDLRHATWKRILCVARVPHREIHQFKSTHVAISLAERLPIAHISGQTGSTSRTLHVSYGASDDPEQYRFGADLVGLGEAWRARHEADDMRAATLAAAAAERKAKLEAAKARPDRRRKPRR